MARSRLRKESLAGGDYGSEERLATVVGQLRRRLSLACVRANSTCLLDRVFVVGEGAPAARSRRQWASLEEQRMRKEKETSWQYKIRGPVVRRGRFFLD